MQQLQGDGPLVRIGELSRRLGVSVHVLRAWESRYGLLQPTRSTGGFRLYSAADEARIRRMQAHLDEGLSAAEAARTVLREERKRGSWIRRNRSRRLPSSTWPRRCGRPLTRSTNQPRRRCWTG